MQVHNLCHYNCVNYVPDLIRCPLSRSQAAGFHISCSRAPWLSQAQVSCGQPGLPHGPESSSALLPPGAEPCPSPNSLAKAEPDLLRTKTRQRKWTYDKREIYLSLSACLPLRLTVLALPDSLSRASAHIVLCPAAASVNWLLPPGNNFLASCWSLDFQASKLAKQSLKLSTWTEYRMLKGISFSVPAGMFLSGKSQCRLTCFLLPTVLLN